MATVRPLPLGTDQRRTQHSDILGRVQSPATASLPRVLGRAEDTLVTSQPAGQGVGVDRYQRTDGLTGIQRLHR